MVRYSVTVAGEKRLVEVEDRAGEVIVTVDGTARTLDVRTPPGVGAGGRYDWIDGSRVVSAEVERSGDKLAVTLDGHTIPVLVADARLDEVLRVAPAAARAAGPSTVRAPMAGRVVKLLVRVGDAVQAGQGLLVIEAMKMENEVRSPRAGQVREIKVSEGAAVDGEEDLAILE